MDASTADFFTRLAIPDPQLDSADTLQARCNAFARGAFPGAAIRPAPFQGFCSYTLLVNNDAVVQFRPAVHGLDLAVTDMASDVYGPLAPRTHYLGSVANDLLRVYLLSRIPGVSLADLRLTSTPSSDANAALVRAFAHFIARGWRAAVPAASSSPLRRRIGSSLRPRLQLLSSQLPGRFRPVASSVLASLDDIEALPWALTHGDVVPGNIMVDPPATMTGLLDWAEAEHLPLGVGLYGLEEFLGASTAAVATGAQYPAPTSRFAYHADAERLRDMFWAELEAVIAVPGLPPRDVLEQARRLGILLWHGIAFDGGRLDRVVQEGVDDAEIQRLDLFLLGGGGAEKRESVEVVDDDDVNGAILDEILDEEDAQGVPSAPQPGSTQPRSEGDSSPVPVPGPAAVPLGERRPSFRRRAWNYFRRLGKL